MLLPFASVSKSLSKTGKSRDRPFPGEDKIMKLSVEAVIDCPWTVDRVVVEDVKNRSKADDSRMMNG